MIGSDFLRTHESPHQPPQRLGVDGLGYESICRDQLQIGAPVTAHQHPRYVRHGGVRLHGLQYFRTVKAGHRKVAQHQCWRTFACQDQAGKAVGGDDGPAIFAFDDRSNELNKVRIIVDHDDDWLTI